MDQVMGSLATAGPLALVLGVAVYTLWRANVDERLRHAAEEEQERTRNAAAEERWRGEYVSLLKELTKAVREDSHGDK